MDKHLLRPTLPPITRLRAVLRIFHRHVMILRQQRMRRLHDRLTCILRHRIRTHLRFRRMKMCNPSVGLLGQENPLIGLETGPHYFEVGESVTVLLLATAFIDC